MTEEYLKKSRDTLGKIIKKPPLTDKLLRKPPFRFLHDIFTEVIRTTGFLNGLFSAAELDSKNVSVKEDKMAFLQKIVDVVSIVSGEQLSVKPSKIVAGHEPEKTNELLQAIAKCINRNVSSDDAVKQVVSGKTMSKVQEKPPPGHSKRRESKETRERTEDPRKKRRNRDEEKHERESSSDRRRSLAGKEGRERSSDRHRSSASKEMGEKSHDKDQDATGDEGKDGHRSVERSREKEKNKDDRSRESKEERRERRDSKLRSKESSSGSKKSVDKRSSTKLVRKSSSEEKKALLGSKQKKASSSNSSEGERKRRRSQPRKEEESHDKEETESRERSRHREGDEEGKSQENLEEREEDTGEKSAGSRPPRPASAKGHRRRQPADRGSRGSAPEGRETSPKESRSRPARPPSARPAAPRVRQRPNAAEEEIARMESAGRHRTAPIIVDRGSRPAGEGVSSSDDEDEQFLVQEEDVQPPEMGKLSPVTNGDVNGEAADDEEHGGLVKKILETKKKLETSASKGANVAGKRRTEIERAPVNEAQRRKEREVVMRDIEKLRASVQKLCRSAVPLGKIIDYIQEDMDSMQNELLQWKKENKEHAAKLKEEDSVTTKTIEPLQAELDELDRSIAAQLDMIAASKCNVIKNQEKIDKMVAGVTARS